MENYGETPKPGIKASSSKSQSIIGAIGSFDDAEQPKIERQQNAPNGGYGWVVVFGSFICHVVFGGIERSEGIYFLEFQDRFGRSAPMTSLPGALVTALRLFVGPLAGALSYWYSVRLTCLIGSGLLFLGMMMNAFIEDFEMLFLSHSVLQGIGRGFLYTPSLIIVADYFDKRRGIANGLSTSGTGIGTFVLAPLQQFLFDNYGYMGAFLIIAAISLHTAISAMLYRPLIARRESVQPAVSGQLVVSDEGPMLPPYNISGSSVDTVKQIRDLSDVLKKQKKVAVTTGIYVQRLKSGGVCLPDNFSDYTYDSESSADHVRQVCTDSVEKFKMVKISLKASESVSTKRSLQSFVSIQKKRIKSSSERLSNHLSVKLLKNPPFVMFCFSITLFTAASKSAFTFMPALITSRGYSQSEAAFVLSITGAVDIIGRIGAGLLFDMIQSRLIRPVICNIFICILAIVTFILPLLNGYVAMSLTCAVNSILTGAYVSQKTVISMDVLGPSNIPNSIAIFVFFQGFGVFVGVPLSGALVDLTGGYNVTFYLCGALMVGAGIFMSLSNIYIRNQEKANGTL